MNTEIAFRSIFKKFKNTCHIVEFDLNTECVDKSNSCKLCFGTGNVLKKIYKTQVVIDSGIPVAGSVRNLSQNDIGTHYKDGRVGYFLKDCAFDLSPGISRMVLNTLSGQIVDIFDMQYLKPTVVNDNVIFYDAALTRSNINSSERIQILNSLIKDR